jgi:hypothetical protein
MRSLIGIIALSGFLQAAYGGDDAVVTICYIPLGVETFIPITAENIDAHCSRIGEVNINNKRILNLQEIIKLAGAGSFDGESVRVKIVVDGSDVIYIDNYGGVRIGELQYRLDDFSFVRVKNIIEKITKQKN